MRVIAGRLRGRLMHTPSARSRAAQELRPSSQRTRTALFDALAARVAGARVLDLYAGAGSLGIEALSRGAAHAVFAERSPAALAALRRNLRELELTGCSRVLSEDVESALARLRGEGARFDLVLMDPPYGPGRDRLGGDGPGTEKGKEKHKGAERETGRGRRRSGDRSGDVDARSDREPAGAAGGSAWQRALAALAEPGAWLVAERSRRDGTWTLPGWTLRDSRAHGETRMDCYERAEGGEDD
jgi:16S rRNA G966 N2-methylase RsmD